VKVSIITVVYNGSQTVKGCIESVLSQTYNNIEYIVIDGNSTDGTQQIIENFGLKIAVFKSEPDNGIYDAMNKGIALATGDIVGILNADDLYKDNRVIEKIVNKLEETQAEGLYADLIFVDGSNLNKVTRYWKSGSYDNNSFLYGWMPPHPTFFVKRASYQKYGVFSLNLGTAADYELLLRLIHKHRLKIAYLQEITVLMRAGGASNDSAKSRIKANQNDRKAWELNNLKPYFFTLWLKPLRKIVQFINRR
jgi:glycosyltransferase involved in cell wall biosynthesis